MKALVDSYGFVASFSKYHEHHLSSLELLLRYKARDVCTAAHSFAEAYASLTGLPGAKRVTPDEAVLFLGSIHERLKAIALDAADSLHPAELAAENGASGGGIYDVIVGQGFFKSRAEVLYTWNREHIQRMKANIGRKVRRPQGIVSPSPLVQTSPAFGEKPINGPRRTDSSAASLASVRYLPESAPANGTTNHGTLLTTPRPPPLAAIAVCIANLGASIRSYPEF